MLSNRNGYFVKDRASTNEYLMLLFFRMSDFIVLYHGPRVHI